MNLKSSIMLLSLLLAGGVLAPIVPVRAADVYTVAPNAYIFANGPNAIGYPFLIEQQFLTSMRYQQVYDASQFSVIGAGGGFINTIFVRADEGNSHPLMSTIGNIQVDLSTTTKGPDGLSTTFANNVGVDDLLVFSGSLHLSASPGQPAAFKLDRPFFYNPAAGNLLMDVRNFTGAPGPLDMNMPYMDAVRTAGDSTSIIFATSVSALTGTADTGGLITGFIITPVPEPSTVALVLVGLAGLSTVTRLTARRRRRRE